MVVGLAKRIPGGLSEAALRLRGNAMCSGTNRDGFGGFVAESPVGSLPS
jgi:hypothetical protein